MIEVVAEESGIRISQRVELPGKSASFLPPPMELHPDVLSFLKGKYPSGLYGHQSKAITAVLSGKDICLSTSTASGKSAVFISNAADVLKRERHARVIAFYPLRALIQDQLAKWKEALDPLGFSVGVIHG